MMLPLRPSVTFPRSSLAEVPSAGRHQFRAIDSTDHIRSHSHCNGAVEFHGPRKPTLASDAEQVYRYLLHTNGLYLPVWQAFREAGVTGRALYAAAANRQALEKLLDMAVVPKWRSAQLVELLTREFATNNQPPLFRTRTVLAADRKSTRLNSSH